MAPQGDGALPLHQLQIFESTDVVANQVRAWGPGWESQVESGLLWREVELGQDQMATWFTQIQPEPRGR